MFNLENQFLDLVEKIKIDKEILSPSEFAEKYRYLTSDVSTIQGKFKYSLTPYTRELIDMLSPYSPAKVIGIMKGAQIGLTEGLIVNGICWIIANNPGNIMALSANEDLSREMIESRLDQGIRSCGIQHLIRPNTIRKRNNRTGDTSQSKEFAGGRLFAGSVQGIDKLGKQRSIKYGFFDDFESAPVADKDQGNIFELLQQRFSTASNSMKQYFISTPENKPSNIERVYLMGDQRKWHIPCPCCGEMIEIIWHQKNDNNESVGVFYETDQNGKLKPSSVGYVCQKCGGFFKETIKYEQNQHGIWIPTAEPERIGYYSYHIPALIAGPHCFGWTDYAEKWIDIFKGGNESKAKLRVFKNVVLGEPFEDKRKQASANQLMKNIRNYEVGTVPNALSKLDGNGEIILLTCSCDLNGTVDDARLDYEVVAHSESGSTYSIDQGSIGTYQPKLSKDDRELWSYDIKNQVNVWNEFMNKVILKNYPTDDNQEMRIFKTGIDTGYYSDFAYNFIDSNPQLLYGLKGDIEDKPLKANADIPMFKRAKERANLYILEVNKLKDQLDERMSLKWNEGTEQPNGFMNFPNPVGEKYKYETYFKHYEAEVKKLTTNDDGEVIGWLWQKKNTMSQNHFFDCAVYNRGLREIIFQNTCKGQGIKYPTWADFVRLVKN